MLMFFNYGCPPKTGDSGLYTVQRPEANPIFPGKSLPRGIGLVAGKTQRRGERRGAQGSGRAPLIPTFSEERRNQKTGLAIFHLVYISDV